MESEYIIEDTDIRRLIVKAIEARDMAYARYSQFKVGAALLAGREDYSDAAECVGGESDNNDKNANGYRVFTGCNIENSSFGATNCAERTAIFKAVSEGVKDFKAIAIVCSGDQPAYPCGICRQVMSEFFNSDTRIIVEEGSGLKSYTMSEILPDSFSL